MSKNLFAASNACTSVGAQWCNLQVQVCRCIYSHVWSVPWQMCWLILWIQDLTPVWMERVLYVASVEWHVSERKAPVSSSVSILVHLQHSPTHTTEEHASPCPCSAFYIHGMMCQSATYQLSSPRPGRICDRLCVDQFRKPSFKHTAAQITQLPQSR